ncbi:acetylornithine deacetylase [Nordella sp. HKS 07]|uniref:acetylornithine deacetylase n=1 Tax=Nordella sp. HKS 07 TaxID=2712222 RepID=UPI0013E147AB|nr:acetylornithine deacetylase [Nordella sp. HKS 07]QIG49644.1 acetylornithine deacetylase [Nordella sp. HKS 07]
MSTSVPPQSRAILERLVSFDTTSRNSNLPLIEYVESYLARHGVRSRRVGSADERKTNLFATIGPDAPGGLILSGHTDCVPVDDQDWSSDPFVLTEREGRLFGRGSADMKGFLACVLAVVPELVANPRAKPIHIAFSYDEEVGCTGVLELVDDLNARGFQADMCLVGEPTGMELVIGHKSGRAYRCLVTGLEAHSSLAPRAVNAIEIAARLIAGISEIAREFARGIRDDDFDLPHATINTGLIEGGTGINIVPHHCSFTFEYRLLAGQDPDEVFNRVKAMADALLPLMRAIHPGADIVFEQIYDYPGHFIASDTPAVQRMIALSGSNRLAKVAYGTEAGHLQNGLGVPTVICGPGDIAVAHKPDEFVTLDQLRRCEDLLKRLCGAG